MNGFAKVMPHDKVGTSEVQAPTLIHHLAASIRLTGAQIQHIVGRPFETTGRLAGHAWFYGKLGRRIAAGPFAGMRYPIVWPHLPCMIGTYEKELNFLWPRIFDHGFRHFVDVGSADGYYAVGLARAIPELSVDAFEAEPAKRTHIARIARANEVSGRINIRGFCDTDSLREVLAPVPTQSTLLLMDVEGAEKTLLDPAQIPELRRLHILTEVHGGNGPLLSERFFRSHTLTPIRASPRRFSDLPSPGMLNLLPGTRQFAVAALDERRRQDGIEWLWMVPNEQETH